MSDPKKSNDEKVAEYRHAIIILTAGARVIAGIDVPTLLQAIEYADGLGPLLDPTLWRDKHQAMEEDRQLLRAALPLHHFGKMLLEKFPVDPTQGPRGVQGADDDDGCPV